VSVKPKSTSRTANKKRRRGDWGPDIVAHASSPSYLGGKNWEDCDAKPARAKS
jgi:hypothetical protein